MYHCRNSRLSTELVNLIVNIIVINSNKGFNEVFLGKILSTGVYTNEDISNILFISL